jgi:NDP-sugar pyrophosphorylase family protein
MQGVILAAGKGKRLEPLTTNRSKAMLPVLGRPIAGRVLDDLASCGVEEFILVAGAEDAEIRSYFQGADIRIVTQPKPSGMADALRCAAPFIRGDFILSACDNLVPLADLHQMVNAWRTARVQDNLHGLLALLPMSAEELAHSAAVKIDGNRVKRIVEKPPIGMAPSNLASLPLYIFSAALLPLLEFVKPSPRGEYELQEAIQALIEEGGPVEGIAVTSRLTLTHPIDLLKINLAYLQRSGMGLSSLPNHIRVTPPVWIDPGVEIGHGCCIGPNVYLESGSSIGARAEVSEVVVLRGAQVAERAKIQGQVVS